MSGGNGTNEGVERCGQQRIYQLHLPGKENVEATAQTTNLAGGGASKAGKRKKSGNSGRDGVDDGLGADRLEPLVFAYARHTADEAVDTQAGKNGMNCGAKRQMS